MNIPTNTTPSLGRLGANAQQMYDAGRGSGSTLGSIMGRVGKSIESSPTGWGMGLNAASNALTSGSTNRANDAASRLTEAQISELEAETERKRKKDESMEQLRQMLSSSMPDFNRRTPPAWEHSP